MKCFVQMRAIWWILIHNKEDGPYPLDIIREDPRMTMDTYVWKSGWEKWRLARNVPEIKKFLEEREKREKKTKDFPKKLKKKKLAEDEILTMRHEPPNFFLWLILAIIVLLYFLYIIFY